MQSPTESGLQRDADLTNPDPSRAAPLPGLSSAESGYSTVRYQGLWLYGESRTSWLKRVDQTLRGNGPCIRLYPVNPELVAATLRDPDFHGVMSRGNWNVVDGMWLVLAIAFRRRILLKRNCGSDLIYDLLAGCQEIGRPVFFIGGKPERLEMALRSVRRMYPNLKCEGHSPPFLPGKAVADEEVLRRKIEEMKPAVVAVCLGAPKQETWIDENSDWLSSHDVRIAAALGGTVDFLSGAIPRAPKILRRVGLEWLFRIAIEPVRIFRYLKALPSLFQLER